MWSSGWLDYRSTKQESGNPLTLLVRRINWVMDRSKSQINLVMVKRGWGWWGGVGLGSVKHWGATQQDPRQPFMS